MTEMNVCIMCVHAYGGGLRVITWLCGGGLRVMSQTRPGWRAKGYHLAVWRRAKSYVTNCDL